MALVSTQGSSNPVRALCHLQNQGDWSGLGHRKEDRGGTWRHLGPRTVMRGACMTVRLPVLSVAAVAETDEEREST